MLSVSYVSLTNRARSSLLYISGDVDLLLQPSLSLADELLSGELLWCDTGIHEVRWWRGTQL